MHNIYFALGPSSKSRELNCILLQGWAHFAPSTKFLWQIILIFLLLTLVYNGNLNSGLIQYLKGQKLLITEWSGIQMIFEYWNKFSLVFIIPFEYGASKSSLFRCFRYLDPSCTHYSGDLKSGLVWILNALKEVGLQMVWILKGIWNPEAQPFEIRTNGCHLVKNHLKSGKTSRFWTVLFSNGWDHSHS